MSDKAVQLALPDVRVNLGVAECKDKASASPHCHSRTRKQPLRRNPRAIPPHCSRHSAGARNDLTPQTVRESAGKRIPRGWAGYMRYTDAKPIDPLGPVVLIVVIGDHHLRHAGKRGCGCRSGAAVMNDGSNLREQPMHVDLANREAIGFVFNQ